MRSTRRPLGYQQDITYSTRGYLELLAAYSGHRALEPEHLKGLFIAARVDGTGTKRYLYELRLAQRRPGPSAGVSR